MEKELIWILPEIKEALHEGKPVVALESTIISHGMPYPENEKFANDVEAVVRAEGAIPATIAVINGVLKVGLTPEDLHLMAQGENVAKASRRDLPYLTAPGALAGTLGIVLMSWIFSVFIAASVRYPLVYGSLASLILLMFWLFLCCQVIYLGAAVNLAIWKVTQDGKKEKTEESSNE